MPGRSFVPVSGTITLDGQPLDGASVKFIREDGTIAAGTTTGATSNAVLEALYKGLLLRNRDSAQMMLDFGDDTESKTSEFNTEWQNAADREKKSRSLFAELVLSSTARRLDRYCGTVGVRYLPPRDRATNFKPEC
jgi:hypothetical protein